MNIERLKGTRMDRDKTQADIAKVLNISREVYGRYERGIRPIPVNLLYELSYYYKVSMEYLIGVTDISTPYPLSLIEKDRREHLKNNFTIKS